jgi:anthranilate 1,2-dioxygenase small subunit
MTLADLSEVELQFRVERLLARYAQCIDDDELEAWPELFTDNCVYRVIARENFERQLPIAAIFCDSKRMLIDRVVSARHANIYEKHTYRHLVSSTLVSAPTGDSVIAASHYAVYRTRTNGVTEIYNTGRYRDEIVCHEGVWLFRAKLVVFDTHRVDSLLVTPL